MTKKCIYCGKEIESESIVDFCESCGVKVWGKKMFDAIVENMENAKSRGDLVHDNKQTIKNEESNDVDKSY
jgi:uncharacterized UBP type Zn finger protein